MKNLVLYIIERLSERLNIPKEQISGNTALSEIGLDSVEAANLIHVIKNDFSVELDILFLLEGPTIAELAERIGSSEKIEAGTDELIVRHNETEALLSPVQVRLWKLQTLRPRSAELNIGVMYHFRGEIQFNQLKKVVKECLITHDALHVSFKQRQQTPIQVINVGQTVDIPTVDLSIRSKNQAEAQSRKIIDKVINEPFDLSCPPLWRAKWIKFQDHIGLVLVAHHIVADGWSFQLLGQEFLEACDEYKRSVSSGVAHLPQFSYLDYAEAAARKFDREASIECASEHLDRHSGMSKNFFSDEAIEVDYRWSSKVESVVLDSNEFSNARAFAIESGVTLQSVLLSSFLLALEAQFADDDFSVLMPVANRESLEHARTFGLFANLISLRNKCDKNSTLLDFVKQTHKYFLRAYANRLLPFDIFVDELRQRGSFVDSQFEVFFDYQRLKDYKNESFEVTLSKLDSGFSDFCISLNCVEKDDTVSCDFQYREQLFSEQTIRSLLAIFHEIVQILPVNANQLIEEHRLQKFNHLPSILVSANYSVEPLHKSLSFWLKKINDGQHIHVLPYGQVLQNFIGTSSRMLLNNSGVNVILLSLGHEKNNKFNKQRLEQTIDVSEFSAKNNYLLPNGMHISHLHKGETDFLYKEIFENHEYLQHGIELPEKANIIDVGANIGMFSLYANLVCENPRVFAFEPVEDVFEILASNMQRYGLKNVVCANQGVSNSTEDRILQYYPMSSLQSGFYADEKYEEGIVERFAKNQMKNIQSVGQNANYSSEIMKDRFLSSSLLCSMTTVSNVIKQHKLDVVDLLKIDVEKSEKDVLEGISDTDWARIQQIVIEVHDENGRLREVVDLITLKGFEIHMKQEELFEGTDIYNLYARRASYQVSPEYQSGFLKDERKFGEHLEQLYQHIASKANELKVPTIICLHHHDREPAQSAKIFEVKHKLKKLSEKYPLISFDDLSETVENYQVSTVFDSYKSAVADIPYTEEFFAFLGTSLARSIFRLQTKPYKVIVVDCDNTLWSGACGELGPSGIKVQSHNQLFQEFLIDQVERGVLLCMCSKNTEDDVLEVFGSNDEMLLKLSHFVEWRINWLPKSANIESLSDTLSLGIESFVFIDDNPAECAEVSINLPRVPSLQFPSTYEDVSVFLKSMWMFSFSIITDEDSKRTQSYMKNSLRKSARTQYDSMSEYIEGLNVNAKICELSSDKTNRFIQLLSRVNQFNLTLKNYTPNDIEIISSSDEYFCYSIDVSDKYGDYGFVSSLILKKSGSTLEVDSLLISCRTLGVGLEFQIMEFIAQVATQQGIEEIVLFSKRSGKNTPAIQFLESLALHYGDKKLGELKYQFTPLQLSSVEYFEYSSIDEPMAVVDYAVINKKSNEHYSLSSRACFLEFASRYSHFPTKILQFIEKDNSQKRHRLSENYKSPNTDMQKAIVSIWESVLNVSPIGINDNFFELGGNSLLSVSITSKMKETLSVDIELSEAYRLDTVSKIETYITSLKCEQKKCTSGIGITRLDRSKFLVGNEV